MILDSPARFVPADALRARFAAAMSAMYREEVPLYGALLDLVAQINRDTLAADPALAARLARDGGLARLDEERHGAIRLGTAAELRLVARAFRLLGMAAVGYYDLAPAGIPVHSTAFRAVAPAALAQSPFRVFTSLLRIELIEDEDLRQEAEGVLAGRRIMTDEALALIDRAERQGGLTDGEADRFVPALVETFRWHERALVDHASYDRLLASHRLVADVIAFRGPHINHLTPRTLDIDAAHAAMVARGMDPKQEIEGPPRRACPVLLRQTSFKALNEAISFPTGDGRTVAGAHTARFGEIEERGVALTAAGRDRYDRWIATRGDGAPLDLPDDADDLRRGELAFFTYRWADPARPPPSRLPDAIDRLIEAGELVAAPITYEDFLPVSAAGIFRSNLGTGDRAEVHGATGNRADFAAALGHDPLEMGDLYAAQQTASLTALATAEPVPQPA